MSLIRVDNFGPSAGGTTYSARGIAKAWVNFNGTGTIAARDSENVSSLTDLGTGDYTVNINSAFGEADYGVTLAIGSGSATREKVGFLYQPSFTASAARILTGFTYSSPGAEDQSIVSIATHGDLA